MGTLETVVFEATPDQRDRINKWLKDYGAELTPTEVNPYVTTPAHENPEEVRSYTAVVPNQYKLNIPDWIKRLIMTS